MRKLNCLIFLSIVAHSYANCEYTPSGVSCDKTMVENLIATGIVTLKGTVVDKSTKVSGIFSADKAQLHDLSVQGKANINSSKIDGKCNIRGYLESDSSIFKKSLHLSSNEAKLRNSEIGTNIEINHSIGTPRLILSGTSIVSGNIKFIGSYGEVIKDKSVIIRGKLINGSIKEGGITNVK
ncbi:MAG: hypothetical protein VX335_00035 [Pseudomonadota bacterium]|nr:hypothetical protein [Pseudomonadota bacterium]